MTIDFPEDVQARLEKLSAQSGRPAADYVREIVEEQLAELEWKREIAVHAEAIRAGIEKTRPFDELARELGFDPDEIRARAKSKIEAEQKQHSEHYSLA